jgi:hypothetical protein
VLALAETKKTGAHRILVDLIETGLEAKQAQRRRFFELTDQLAESTDPPNANASKRSSPAWPSPSSVAGSVGPMYVYAPR